MGSSEFSRHQQEEIKLLNAQATSTIMMAGASIQRLVQNRIDYSELKVDTADHINSFKFGFQHPDKGQIEVRTFTEDLRTAKINVSQGVHHWSFIYDTNRTLVPDPVSPQSILHPLDTVSYNKSREASNDFELTMVAINLVGRLPNSHIGYTLNKGPLYLQVAFSTTTTVGDLDEHGELIRKPFGPAYIVNAALLANGEPFNPLVTPNHRFLTNAPKTQGDVTLSRNGETFHLDYRKTTDSIRLIASNTEVAFGQRVDGEIAIDYPVLPVTLVTDPFTNVLQMLQESAPI